MNLDRKIADFALLGNKLVDLSENIEDNVFNEQITKAQVNNPWFTQESIKFAFSEIGNSLAQENLNNWVENYSILSTIPQKTIGIIMAGNIPLVGFHDLLCTIFSGHKAFAKLSSKDQHLYKILLKILIEINPEYGNLIQIKDTTIKNVDAIIATGSNNSARYFEYYFSKYPHIIRKNRNSVAIITGNETDEDFENLGKDIFTYFGLGCRNVSFLMVPESFNFPDLLKALEKFNPILNHTKYANNYDYQKAILLMNNMPIYDNGNLLLKEDKSLSSPIGVVHYIKYTDKNQVNEFIASNKNTIQCVVSKTKWDFPTYSFGLAQKPGLWDYADNIDTLQFLLDLN